MIGPDRDRLVFGLGIGPTPVSLEWAGDELVFAWMRQPLPDFGPLIEDEDRMAERNRATSVEVAQMHPRDADGPQSVTVSVFNYMIGFLDWSAAHFHNVKLIRTEDGRHITVPYDFDFAGVVNARYATPPPSLTEQRRIRRVTQRLYRGFCRPELQYEPVAALFNSKRQEIVDLYRGFELHEEDDIEDALEFYEDFWEVMDDPDEFEDEIINDCRDAGLT